MKRTDLVLAFGFLFAFIAICYLALGQFKDDPRWIHAGYVFIIASIMSLILSSWNGRCCIVETSNDIVFAWGFILLIVSSLVHFTIMITTLTI